MIIFLANLLLASVALAVPTSEVNAVACRTDSQSQGSQNHTKAPAGSVSDYAGVSWLTNEDNFLLITGSFKVPNIIGSAGYGLAAEVGIYSSSCATATDFRGGVIGSINDNHTVEYQAFYETPAAHTGIFPNFPVRVDDEISVNVLTQNMTVEIGIINRSTGDSVVQTYSSNTSFCRNNAIWAVEGSRVDEKGQTVPLANFSQFEFTTVYGYNVSGSEYVAPDPTIFNIEVDGKDVTSTSASQQDHTVTIQYLP